MNTQITNIRAMGYEFCMKGASDALAKQRIPMPDMMKMQERCWKDRFPDPDLSSQGWEEWFELLLGTAVACGVIYASIWSATVTLKWVWRGRQPKS